MIPRCMSAVSNVTNIQGHNLPLISTSSTSCEAMQTFYSHQMDIANGDIDKKKQTHAIKRGKKTRRIQNRHIVTKLI